MELAYGKKAHNYDQGDDEEDTTTRHQDDHDEYDPYEHDHEETDEGLDVD